MLIPLVRRHAFGDGNKRTGLLAGTALHYLAGCELAAPRDEMVELSVALAAHKLAVEELAIVVVRKTR